MYLIKRYLPKLGRMMLGFTLISIAVMLAKLSFCLTSWNVLNDGVAQVLHTSIGNGTIVVGAVILIIDILSGESIGVAMILNSFLIGWITNLCFKINDRFLLIPRIEYLPMQIVFCIISLVINGLGIYFYMSAQMGAGPRDTLIVFMTKKLPFRIGVCKISLEAAACLLGWLMGGEVGIGTFISVICGGPVLQTIFKLFHFDVRSIKHESLRDTWNVFHRGKAVSSQDR